LDPTYLCAHTTAIITGNVQTRIKPFSRILKISILLCFLVSVKTEKIQLRVRCAVIPLWCACVLQRSIQERYGGDSARRALPDQRQGNIWENNDNTRVNSKTDDLTSALFVHHAKKGALSCQVALKATS